MYKLLKAGFYRLRKELVFKLFIVSSIIVAIFIAKKDYKAWGQVGINEAIVEFMIYIGFFISIFVSIFVGKEHSEGIIRNKIIVRT